MRRMIDNALDLYKRRTPNIITTTWFTAALTDTGAGGRAFEGRAFQPNGVTSAKFWVYANGDDPTNTTTVTIGDQTGVITDVSDGGFAWASVTIAVPALSAGVSPPREVKIDLVDVQIQGVCAWYETIS